MMRTLFTGLILLAALACRGPFISTRGSHIYFDPKAQSLRPPGHAPNIKTFYKSQPPSAYVEIGLVEAVAQGPRVSLQDLFPELKKQAAKMNADAIHKIELQRYEHQREALHATAVAIVFLKRKPGPQAPIK